MGAYIGLVILGVSGIIWFIVKVVVGVSDAAIETKDRKQALEDPSVKATVKKVMPLDGAAAQVIFELEDGRRINLKVNRCTMTEGDTGILCYHGNTYVYFV